MRTVFVVNFSRLACLLFIGRYQVRMWEFSVILDLFLFFQICLLCDIKSYCTCIRLEQYGQNGPVGVSPPFAQHPSAYCNTDGLFTACVDFTSLPTFHNYLLHRFHPFSHLSFFVSFIHLSSFYPVSLTSFYILFLCPRVSVAKLLHFWGQTYLWTQLLFHGMIWRRYEKKLQSGQ